MKLNFESAIEKLGRILARQYHINVVYEGTQAKTDGKTISLPLVKEMNEELWRDLNGYLDHEVGHCKFTEFDEMKQIKTKMHRELFNIAEDNRIEREMIKEFPGCALNLDPLNAKLKSELNKKWEELPWPVRTILGVGDIMNGRTPRIDEDTERYIDVVKEAAQELRYCKDTKEIREKTHEIIQKIIEEREEEKEEDGEGEGEGGEGESKEDKMLSEKTDSKDPSSEWEKHSTNVSDMVNDELGDHIKDEDKPSRRDSTPDGFDKTPHIPVTTRFDTVTDHSGKGNPANYSRLKREVASLVNPIKQQLERILKVQENAKWVSERERGGLDKRNLAKLASNKGYRTVFKEHMKTETNNVAVELLVDMSGSMSGSKIHNAKLTAIAIGEALKDLQIPFEVTGFYSEPDNKVSQVARELGVETGYGRSKSRFNRTYEALRLHVFKDFSSAQMSGLEKLHVGSQNPDGECVAWAAKRIAQRREKRKILMVLSDGLPATGDGDFGILNNDLKTKIEKIKKSGIECIGIGIESDAVKRFYPDYVVLGNVKDLPKSAMKKISQLITNGAKMR